MDIANIIYLIGVVINLLILIVILYKKYQEGEEIRIFTIIGGCIASCGSLFILLMLTFLVLICSKSDKINVVVFKKRKGIKL